MESIDENWIIDLIENHTPVDTGRKLNVHKTFRKRPERLLNVLCTFNLRPVSTGKLSYEQAGIIVKRDILVCGVFFSVC